MTPIRQSSPSVLAGALIILLLGLGPVAAEAKQTSLDSRIFQAFEKIDGRTNSHEKDVVRMRARLEQLTVEMGKLRTQLSEQPDDGTPEQQRRRRRALHGKMINLSAEYLNQSYKLVDSAAQVISENLSDLAKLAAEVRKSDDPTGGGAKLQKRIRQNIAAGRSMRNALVDLRNWARQDPNLASRFHSLRRITGTLDRRISVDKARLSGRSMDATGSIRNKRLEALDQTVDRLGDMYAEVIAEKDTLKDLRDEVAIAVQLGRLELTQEVAERAIPNIGSIRTPSTGGKPLVDMVEIIADLNGSLVEETANPVVSQAISTSRPAGMEISGFTNF